MFPQLFRVPPNFHDCLYNSIETRSTCFLFSTQKDSRAPMLEYFCCFPLTSVLMRCNTISPATLISSTPSFLLLLFTFWPCYKLPSLRHLGTTCKSGGATLLGRARPCQNCFQFAIKSECKFWYARGLLLC